MKFKINLLLPFLIFMLGACTVANRDSSQSQADLLLETCQQPPSDFESDIGYAFESEDAAEIDIERGQRVYVPFYSQVPRSDGGGSLDLFGFLSIRNTSETESILITDIRYFNTAGDLVGNCLADTTLRLQPMATAEFAIARSDRSGGSGANFIVEWVSERAVSDPLIEAIMHAGVGNFGYTFLSHGRVIEEFSE